jgi:PAS domain S-box-containing protein
MDNDAGSTSHQNFETRKAMPQVYLPPGGTMGELIRSHDWSKTSLGPMEQWPHTLLTGLAIMLESPFPQFICWGRELTMLYNDAYLDVLSKQHPALGKSLLEVCPQAREILGPMIEKAFAGESVIMENVQVTLMRHGYPEQTWADFSFSPIRDSMGNVVGLIVNVNQLTKRVRELKESEERFKAIFEQAAVGLALTDPSGKLLKVNEKYCRLTGYSAEELLRLTYQEITHPDDLERDVAQAKRLLSGEITTYTIDKRYIGKNGAVVWVKLTCSLVRNKQGEPDYFIAVVEDISERKRAEEELQNAYGLIESITKGTADLIAAEDCEFRFI